MTLQIIEVNGGQVSSGPPKHLEIPASNTAYTNAQLDDYHGLRRKEYLWNPGTHLSIRARFSHSAAELKGTAGFGFWNAPFGDPSVPWPASPRSVWFFFASAPNNLPLALEGPGRGWFASTIDAPLSRSGLILPAAPALLILNQFTALRSYFWPWLRSYFGISFQLIGKNLEDWHKYDLSWQSNHCKFLVDDELVHQTSHSPNGPLGFVCWIDNQYMVATPKGKVRWGTLKLGHSQWLEVEELELSQGFETN